MDLMNYIDGNFQAHTGEQWLDVVEPATGKQFARVPLSSPSDVDSAILAARKAQPEWGGLSHSERAGWLDIIADELESRYEDIASLESRDTGKPISLARAVDANRSVANFRFFAEMIRGTSTGAKVAASAAPHFKKISLELGGKNSSIVFADCDLNKTIEGVGRAAFLNQGQICLCGSRILVQDSIYDEFVEGFIDSVESLKIGDPSEDSTQLGALISSGHLKKVKEYVSIAKDEGGHFLTGGDDMEIQSSLSRDLEGGYWMAPTVIGGLSPDSRCSTEEIFGPVVTVHRFKTEEEAIEIANGTRYGLAGSVWTEDLEKGIRVAEGIRTGMVWVNTWLHRDLRTPFGGVGDSGVGREGGRWSLGFFSETLNVCVKR